MSINFLLATDAFQVEIKHLMSENLGPGQYARSAYRLREQADSSLQFTLLAVSPEKKANQLMGIAHFTSLSIGTMERERQNAMLLGPLLVAEQFRGDHLGEKLIEQGCLQAAEKGADLILLVGDLSYYQRAGFNPVDPGRLQMPGPIDPARLLAKELEAEAKEKYCGVIRGKSQ